MANRFETRAATGHIAVLCSDFRLESGARSQLRKAGIIEPDIIRLPGGCGSLGSLDFPGYEEVILDATSRLVGLHDVKSVVLLNHQSCGAYYSFGHRFSTCSFTEEEKRFHIFELERARIRMRAHLDKRAFQGIDVKAGVYWADTDDGLHIHWIK